MLVQVLDLDIDTLRLHSEATRLRKRLNNLRQIALQSTHGGDDWTSGTGTQQTAGQFCIINKTITNSYMAELILSFPDYYRWRLLTLEPRHSYTVHRDGRGRSNYRIHIPVQTNPDCYLQFYDCEPQDAVTVSVTHHRLKLGRAYRVDTTDLHTAVNWGTEPRIHLVGEQDQ